MRPAHLILLRRRSRTGCAPTGGVCGGSDRGSGRSHIHAATLTMVAVPSAANHGFGETRNITTAHAAIAIVAVDLARRLIAPSRSQVVIIGPNTGCASSPSCSRPELRAAANAASRMNGVVGRPGTTIPMMPGAIAT